MPTENVCDYPRPPRIEPSTDELRITFAGATIAETRHSFRVLETSHPPVYCLPRDAFRCELILSGTRRSFCEWKGWASYWTMRANGREARDCAWSYPEPTAAFAALADHLAVYPAAMDQCYVNGERVVAQAGDFYGGWITSNITGPFKGAPGTRHW